MMSEPMRNLDVPAVSGSRAVPELEYPRRETSWDLEPVTGNDGIWLQDSHTNRMIIHAVCTMDRMDIGTLRKIWDRKVLQADGGKRYPRFRKRVVTVNGRHHWEDDEAFDIRRHIVEAPVRRLADRHALQDYLGRVADQPLPTDRPLWQIHFMEEFEEDASAFIVRIHHAMGDGIALVPILFSLTDPGPQADPEAPPPPTVPLPATEKKGYGSPAVRTLAALAGPYVLLRKMVRRADCNALRGPALSGRKRFAWSPPIDMDLVKEMKNRLDATVNDVLMACVAGAVHRYQAACSGQPLETVRASIPVNVRAPGERLKMENKFATALLRLPAGASEPQERVLRTKERMDRLKRSVEPLVMYGAANVMLKVLPPKLSKRVIDFFANKCTCVLTNVPGPQHPLYLAGHRVRGLMFWVPQRADIGVGISILSFSSEFRVGVISDVEVVSRPEEVVEAFETEFRALARSLGLAGDERLPTGGHLRSPSPDGPASTA